MFDELVAEAGTDDPASVYRTVAEVACRRLDGVGSASVTTWDGRQFATAAATDDTARRADQLQYDRRSGPSVTVVVDERLCHVADLRDDERWPAGGGSCASSRPAKRACALTQNPRSWHEAS